MIADHQYNEMLTQLRSSISYGIYPIQCMVDAPFYWYKKLSYHFLAKDAIMTENFKLRTKQLRLLGYTHKLLALEVENINLKKLFNSTTKEKLTFLVANTLHINPDPFKHQITLDRGKKQGTYIGQPIIDANGIMGAVISINALTSDVMLLTDKSISVPVVNARNGIRFIVVGTGKTNQLELQHVLSTADIAIGDTMLTSGLGRRYPAGYHVGIITEIHNNPGKTFATILLKPSAKLERSMQVLLVGTKQELS